MASGDQKDWSRSRHEVRGSGSASRIRLNTGLLEEAGWKILSRESGNQVHLTYVDPEGKKFKSSKDIERLVAWSLVVMFRFPLHKIQKFEVIF